MTTRKKLSFYSVASADCPRIVRGNWGHLSASALPYRGERTDGQPPTVDFSEGVDQ